ncbi:hypothetical protein QWY84_06590 [Aquisalimonas lutea]|uniref:hypothetical protein n=1 Tax=Aquisalimonas lutea TaxID=1327750 RepID=UPI0025B5DD4B|nr:hypothetical protein [Aquisalimonas lutea]MDN3517267.1 hypothetical protein [Aquisalimonas lutea]
MWVMALGGATDNALYQTDDVDIVLSSQDEMKAFQVYFHGRLILPGIDHATPEIGRIEVGSPHPLSIDILAAPFGLKREHVQKRAVVMYLETSDGERVGARLIHPAHALIGLVENYLHLPAKRDQWTLDRLQGLFPVVRRYTIETSRDSDHRKAARWVAQTLYRFCSSRDGVKFHSDTGIDLLGAIPGPDEADLGAMFRNREEPKLQQHVARKRRGRQRLLQATQSRTQQD